MNLPGMRSVTNRKGRHESGEPNRHPLWLRVVLMTLLIIAVCVAFYLNNLRIIEQLNP